MKNIVYDVDNCLLGSTAVSSLVELSVEFVWLYIDSYLHFSINVIDWLIFNMQINYYSNKDALKSDFQIYEEQKIT